jgi:hypothetical protein
MCVVVFVVVAVAALALGGDRRLIGVFSSRLCFFFGVFLVGAAFQDRCSGNISPPIVYEEIPDREPLLLRGGGGYG